MQNEECRMGNGKYRMENAELLQKEEERMENIE
jgi:hypothetical protein